MDRADQILDSALRKWERIIEREGDMNGERLKYSYLKKIIQETAREYAFEDELGRKAKAAPKESAQTATRASTRLTNQF